MDAGDREELTSVMARLRSGHDVLPFMTSHYPVADMQPRPMPDDMQALLEAAPDYQAVHPGLGPVWLQIASGNDAAELVVYRTRASGNLYVMAPVREP
ncbi:hypothetical protein U1701_17820 [Sphingomonas sp. PB2P19]|uniref:hypothetical protein n=1 Tax=Sphingomonas rhamnosi TaxID=3096156 RepID=UPI002FC9D7B5